MTRVESLCEILGIKRHMLAMSIGLNDGPWLEDHLRTRYLAGIVKILSDAGVPNNEILNKLDEPFEPDREDSGCLLTMIMDS